MKRCSWHALRTGGRAAGTTLFRACLGRALVQQQASAAPSPCPLLWIPACLPATRTHPCSGCATCPGSTQTSIALCFLNDVMFTKMLCSTQCHVAWIKGKHLQVHIGSVDQLGAQYFVLLDQAPLSHTKPVSSMVKSSCEDLTDWLLEKYR